MTYSDHEAFEELEHFDCFLVKEIQGGLRDAPRESRIQNFLLIFKAFPLCTHLPRMTGKRFRHFVPHSDQTTNSTNNQRSHSRGHFQLQIENF